MAESRTLFLREIKSINVNDVLSIFNCSICYEPYILPKILPNCGHSFCQRCLVSVVETTRDWSEIVCPECRTASPLTDEAIKGLKLNIAVQRALDMFTQSTPMSAPENANAHEFCPHQFLTSLVNCPHCTSKFCSGCILRHLESLRMEINWLSSEFDRRADAAIPMLQKLYEQMKATEEANSQINEKNTEIKENSNAIIGEQVLFPNAASRKRALGESNEISDSSADDSEAPKMLRLQDIREKLTGHQETSSEIERINSTSVLYLKLEDLAKVHLRLTKQDIGCGQLFLHLLKVTLDLAQAVEKQRLSQIDDVNMRNLLQILPFETRLHTLARAGEVLQLKEMFASLKTRRAPSCIRYVVEHPDKEEFGRTILHHASENGHVDLVKYLVEELDADVYAKDTIAGSMPIHLAATQGHLEVVRFFAEHFGDLVEAKNCCDDTPLALAAETGQLHIVEFLANEKGANINNECYFKSTPLLYAACEGHLPIIKFLVEKGANLDARDKYGQNDMTAVHWAARFGHVDVLKYLLEVKPKLVESECGEVRNKIAHEAARVGNVEILKFLIDEKHVAVDIRNADGWTPLFRAATEGHVECVKFLIERGADVMANDSDDALAIHSACYYGCSEVVELLLAAKPQLINEADGDGDTPLSIAIQEKHDDLVELLRSKGARH